MAKGRGGWLLAVIILQLGAGVMLAVGGIWALQGGGDFAASAVRRIFSGDMQRVMVIVFGVIELLVGIFLILKLIMGDRFGVLGTVLTIIAALVWICAIVFSDILGSRGIFGGGTANFLSWLYSFASHLIVLGALLASR